MGVETLIAIFNEDYYTHLSGGILEAFGKLFYREIKIYLYPLLNPDSKEIITSETLKVTPQMKELYKFFKFNGKIVDIQNYSKNYLGFSSRKAIKQIKNGEDGWQEMVPEGVAEMIMQNGFFGWKK